MREKFAIFLGCNIPVRLKQYETASRAVLGKLSVELVDIPEFNCCGYPLRNIDRKAFVLSSARNLALAERQGLDMLTLCQCGYGTLRMADHLMKEDASLRREINAILAREGLRYQRKIRVSHLLSVLFHDVGAEVIRENIIRPYENLKIATHYGCHVLRPSNVVQFDNPVAPTLFDQLVEATGAESVEWPTRLDCCGAPLLGTNDTLSLDFAEKKMEDAKMAGARYLVTACPFCQVQFDSVQERIEFERGTNHYLPPILYPQLLGACMGLDKDTLGLDSNRRDVTDIENYLAE
ncbi:MAG: CoB--CoM heterodisulfide reductase iron-sulfur subunit B family protein [Desulfobacteraceae bacterium]|nr:MAG: CoB--CoM heterodisulfide reductase iron-sulfur subunit B family protein [Desulfobacteraceae bacterium]